MADTPPGPSLAATLRARGLAPRKRLGQHFLRDRSFLPRILEAASLERADNVLEIGAGTGVLTDALSEQAERVVAIELDDALVRMLTERFRNRPSVELWPGNVLAFEPRDHFDGPYKVIANIPYYITGPVVRHFLEASLAPELLVLMVQREVAERMAARPPRLSLLGLSVQFYADVRIVTRVPAGAFYPPPKVESAIVRLEPHGAPTEVSADDFFTVARAGFGQRRKQIANSLSTGLQLDRDAVSALLLTAGITSTIRAESIPLEAWIRLAGAWHEAYR